MPESADRMEPCILCFFFSYNVKNELHIYGDLSELHHVTQVCGESDPVGWCNDTLTM